MCKEFGKITRVRLPYAHYGARYDKTATGLKIDQASFEGLQPAPEPKELTGEETAQLRSVLQGLLCLYSTRLDIIADVVPLQSAGCAGAVRHHRQ